MLGVDVGGGLTLSGGEALLHIHKIIPLLEQCRGRGIHIAEDIQEGICCR